MAILPLLTTIIGRRTTRCRRQFRPAPAPPGAEVADDNTTLTAAALEENDDAYDDETDDGRRRNRLFPKVPLVFSCCLVFVLAASACAVCYAIHNKSRKRQKLVPCDPYCTCPAHANV